LRRLNVLPDRAKRAAQTLSTSARKLSLSTRRHLAQHAFTLKNTQYSASMPPAARAFARQLSRENISETDATYF
jgi:hypothetical protein